MMYICMDCQHVFEEPTNRYNKRWSDSDDSEQCCPNCGSTEFEEADECVECGAVKFVENLTNGYCNDCIEIAAEDFDGVMEYGEEYKDSVELNGVLANTFTRTEIEAILLSWLMNNGDPKAEAKRFALDDKYEFTEWLKRRTEK